MYSFQTLLTLWQFLKCPEIVFTNHSILGQYNITEFSPYSSDIISIKITHSYKYDISQFIHRSTAESKFFINFVEVIRKHNDG